jgi:hypothetical protein
MKLTTQLNGRVFLGASKLKDKTKLYFYLGGFDNTKKPTYSLLANKRSV